MIGGFAFWFPHQIEVQDPVSAGGMGGSFAAARPLAAEVKDERRLVRTADGAEVVSNSTVTVPLDSAVAEGALVTVWKGRSEERTASVLAVGRDENAPPLPSHLILSLE